MIRAALHIGLDSIALHGRDSEHDRRNPRQVALFESMHPHSHDLNHTFGRHTTTDIDVATFIAMTQSWNLSGKWLHSAWHVLDLIVVAVSLIADLVLLARAVLSFLLTPSHCHRWQGPLKAWSSALSRMTGVPMATGAAPASQQRSLDMPAQLPVRQGVQCVGGCIGHQRLCSSCWPPLSRGNSYGCARHGLR